MGILDAYFKNMQLAVIATEDQKFPHHYGVDFESLFDVISEAGDHGPSRGASTITQQAAKMCFCFHLTPTFARLMSFTLPC